MNTPFSLVYHKKGYKNISFVQFLFFKHALAIYMNEVPDPRVQYKQRHKFLDILIIEVMVTLCGMNTWNETEDWAHSKKEWQEPFLELPGGIPSHDTINRVFQMLSAEKFHEAFYAGQVGEVAGKIERVVAIDGKTVRGSKNESDGKKAIHVVSAWIHETSIVLGQLKADEKANEMKAIPKLLCLEGCIVTIDAMGTQEEIAEKTLEKGRNMSCR